ncbi:MAG: Maf family protein [Oscillospiraceae bacterium]
MKKLILASRSPRRLELLSLITTHFSVMPSNFDERSITISEPFELVRALSFSKASTIVSQADDIVIGCDTVVFAEGEILGIPKDQDEAYSMIKKLSGKTHSVITGVCVLNNHNVHQFECETMVTFFDLTPADILSYISTDEPYDKAGGYGIQGKAALFVEKVEGDYSNVVGLPISRLNQLLKQLEE